MQGGLAGILPQPPLRRPFWYNITMFIKLTRLDNSPIWLNASFIVTVEPRKGGGTIVVPIGDGLDYEVREKAEAVLAMLEGAPVPAVVPVPTTDSLTQTPEDVSPETEPPDLLPEPAVPAPAKAETVPTANETSAETPKTEAKPARKTSTRKTSAKTAKAPAKPRKKAVKKAAAADADAPAEPVEPVEPPPPPKLTPLALDDGQVERLRKMAPRSIRKLANTLMAQFKLGDPFEAIRALEERNFFKTEGERVLWPVPETTEPAK